MTAINPAVTVRLETKDVTFSWSIPPKTNATLQVLNSDETAFVSVPYNNNTGHPIGLTVTFPFSTPVSKIPTLLVN